MNLCGGNKRGPIDGKAAKRVEITVPKAERTHKDFRVAKCQSQSFTHLSGNKSVLNTVDVFVNLCGGNKRGPIDGKAAKRVEITVPKAERTCKDFRVAKCQSQSFTHLSGK